MGMELSRIGHTILRLSNLGLIGANKSLEAEEKGRRFCISTFYRFLKIFKFPANTMEWIGSKVARVGYGGLRVYDHGPTGDRRRPGIPEPGRCPQTRRRLPFNI